MTKYIWSRGGNERGTIINEVDRWCPACERFCTRLVVRWKGGKITYPCARATEYIKKRLTII